MESRREFIKKAGIAGAGMPLLGGTMLNRSAVQAQNKNKIQVFAFSKHFQFLEDFGDLSDVFAEAGMDGVDLTVRPGGHIEPDAVEEKLPCAVEAMDKRGLNPPMIVTRIIDPSDTYTERILKTANLSGIGYYRMGYIPYDEELGIVKSLQKNKQIFQGLAEINQKYRIHGAYQNHSGTLIGTSVWDLYPLLSELDSDWIGCQYDIRHAMVEGANSWPLALQLIKDWVRCVDVKDYRWEKVKGQWKTLNVPLGEGMVDFVKFFRVLKEYNFSGPISLHIEYDMFDKQDKSLSVDQKRKIALKQLKKDAAHLKEKMDEAELV